MFGYACRETPELMPAPIYYAHRILKLMAEARKSGEAPMLGPDAKSQVTVALRRRQAGRRRPRSSSRPSISTTTHDLGRRPRRWSSRIVRTALPEDWIDADTVWHVNPTGKFVIGGPDGDCGLTGRKIIVDTYGGAAPHGGGAFSGKDPTKVDRSAAYAARYLAKNVVAADLADRCTIQLSYAIGVSQPLSIYVDLHGTGKVEEGRLEKALARGHGPVAARHPPASRPQPADLCPHLRLWPFRPRAGGRRRLLVGADRPRRGDSRRGRLRPLGRSARGRRQWNGATISTAGARASRSRRAASL